jgi:hypothetical protein
MGWQNAHLLVEATNYITGLAFGDDNAPAGCGVVIDNVVMGAASTTQTGTQLVAPSTVLGEPATLTATVLGSSAAVTPTGSVQFAVDGTAAGAPVALANGQAQKTLEGLARGTHTVTAVYTSDSVSFDSSSVMGRVTVRQARTATNVSADPSPVALGQWTTITAEVGVLAPGAGAPTGSVQFADEYGPVGDPVPIDSGGIAQIALLEDLGDRYLYAYYSGDDDFTSSVGSTQLSVFDANPAPAPPSTGGTKIATTTALVSSKNPIEPGESYTVTATVSPGAAGDAVLDGTIAFTINGVAAADPIALDGNRSASVTITPPPGVTRQTVRARYSGNASFLSSTGFLGERIVPPFGAVIRPTNPPPDTHAPVFTLRITPTRLAQALRHGVRVHVDCDENCSASLRLVLTARRAKALGMRVRGKTVLVAQGRYEFADRKASDIVVRFTARARKALAKAKRVPLRLRTTASDLTGNDAVRVQRFTLKR